MPRDGEVVLTLACLRPVAPLSAACKRAADAALAQAGQIEAPVEARR